MSLSWISVLPITDVPSGTYRVVTVNFISIIIAHNNGAYFAVENMCTHDGGELEGGELEGEEIICPRHGAGFCMKTGAVTRPPAYEGIRSFPVRVVENTIQIQI
jgi:3-phenylpropionate/trans-cinnamate dioxygenase ferredoxin subunit